MTCLGPLSWFGALRGEFVTVLKKKLLCVNTSFLVAVPAFQLHILSKMLYVKVDFICSTAWPVNKLWCMWMQAMIRIIQAAVLVIQTVRVGAQTSGESHAFYIGQHLTSFKACLMIEPYSLTVTVTVHQRMSCK